MMSASGITNFLSSNAIWIHSQIKQTPVAGPAYSWITANVGTPFLDVVFRIKDLTMTYFLRPTMTYFLRPTGRFIMSTANNHPRISGAATILLVIVTVRAIIHNMNSDKKPKDDQ